MNAAIFVVEFASLGFSIVSALGRIARTVINSIAIMSAICSALSIACVSAMVLGLPIPSPAPLVLAALSLALLVRSVRESVEENRPAVITVAVPVAPEFAPLPEEIEDIAGSYPMVDRFDVAPPVAQDAAPAPAKVKPVRKAPKSRKPLAPAPVPLEEMPHDELIVLARSAGVKGVSTRWSTAALARRIREARALAS